MLAGSNEPPGQLEPPTSDGSVSVPNGPSTELTTGGVNFDSKVRRESIDPEDLFHAHIAGMDTFARGLKAAAAIRADGRLAEFVKQRYASWDSGLGARIEKGKETLASLEAFALEKGEAAANTSGRQEFLENLINEFI